MSKFGFIVASLFLLVFASSVHASFFDGVSAQTKPFNPRLSFDTIQSNSVDRFEPKSTPKSQSPVFLETNNQRGGSRGSSLSSGEIVFLLSKNRRTYDFTTKKWRYPGKLAGEHRSNFLDSLSRERSKVGSFYSLGDQMISK